MVENTQASKIAAVFEVDDPVLVILLDTENILSNLSRRQLVSPEAVRRLEYARQELLERHLKGN